MTPNIFGSWNEERMYVLKTLEELKEEQRRLMLDAAAERTMLLEKGQRDIKAAHDKIRVLEASGHTLRLKNWLMTAALSGIG